MNKIPSITIGFIALPLHLNFASLTPSRIGYRELRRKALSLHAGLGWDDPPRGVEAGTKVLFVFSYENILDAVR